MASKDTFTDLIGNGYSFQGEHFRLGAAVLGGETLTGTAVNIPLKTMTRHGLIAGATGTGKTKTLQVITEGLSKASVPVLLLDIKGDLSGLASAGVSNARIEERVAAIGATYEPASFPVELLTISDEPGVRVRATVIEFGPVLLSKILGLNDTQSGVVSMIFKYCDDNAMPLVDLEDFAGMLKYFGNEGKKEVEKEYGRISTSTTGTILRKVIELRQQGADAFFGEPSLDLSDIMRVADDGRGMVSILRVTDMQNRPKLFSTFMLSLLAELYATMPEEGDTDRPVFVMFIDEAHLLFQEATDALLEQILTVIKLIRSKGVGIFFCTQNPQDIPAGVLSQLGLKVQHALRAFTAADRKSIRQAAQNYPETDYYNVDELITTLGTGEALVTVLNEKGIPTPLVHTLLVPPASRMDVLTEAEISAVIGKSAIRSKYEKAIDRESAKEMLQRKLERAAENIPAEKPAGRERAEKRSTAEKVLDHSVTRQIGRTAASILTRSLLGALGLGTTRSGRKKSLF